MTKKDLIATRIGGQHIPFTVNCYDSNDNFVFSIIRSQNVIRFGSYILVIAVTQQAVDTVRKTVNRS